MDSDKVIGEIKPRIVFKPSVELLEKMRTLIKSKERYPSIRWTYQGIIEVALKQFLDTYEEKKD